VIPSQNAGGFPLVGLDFETVFEKFFFNYDNAIES
jgi:hypothetical protein